MSRGVWSWLRRRRAAVVGASVLAAVGLALAQSAPGGSTEEVSEELAQSPLNPRPVPGGPRNFGASEAEPVPIGSLKPVHLEVDVSVRTPVGEVALARTFSASMGAWV